VKNIDADYLSRNPMEYNLNNFTKHINSDEIITIVNSSSNTDSVSCNTMNIDILEFNDDNNRPHIDRELLISDQVNDTIVGPVYKLVKSKTRPSKEEWKLLSKKSKLLIQQYKKLRIENELLYRITTSNIQLVLPQQYHNLVYKELHNNMAHLGSDRVTDLARQRFYWPKMQKDIEFYVRKQCKCIRSKKPNREDRAPLVPIISTYPFEIISIDYLHLDRSRGGFEYVLIVCDHFTKFCQAFATKNKNAKSAADKLYNEFMLYYGFPVRIHHDQGKEFNNRLFTRLELLSGISASNTTPYHPIGDGQAERMNRTLINMLKTLDENHKNNWKYHLPKLMFAYNSTINKTTGYSPFFLMFGRSSRLPIDKIFNIENNDNITKIPYRQFVKKWQESMKSAISIVNKNSKLSRKHNEKSYNKKIHGNELIKGDKVLLRNFKEKGGTGKLRSYWEDQIYLVVEKVSDLPVYIIKAENSSKQKKVHRNILMKCNNLLENRNFNTISTKSNINTDKKSKISEKRNLHADSCNSSESSDDSEIEFVVNRQTRSVPVLQTGGEEVSVNSSDHESITSNDSIVTPVPVRRSTRTRRKPKVFTYDELGRDPTYA